MLLKKISAVVFFLAIVFFGTAQTAKAGVVQYPTEQDILLTGPSITLKVEANSQADSVVVDTNKVTITVSYPDAFIIRSDNKYKLTNDLGFAFQCLAGSSRLTINPATSGLTQTVAITPSTALCVPPSTTPSATSPAIVPGVTSSSIVINVGDPTTTAREVTLTLSATNASLMEICNVASFLGCGLETYQTTKQWILEEGDGLKAVYAKFQSSDGGVSSVVSATITLTTPVVQAPVTVVPVVEEPAPVVPTVEEPKVEEPVPTPTPEEVVVAVPPIVIPEIPAILTEEKRVEFVQIIQEAIAQLATQLLNILNQAKSQGITITTEIPADILAITPTPVVAPPPSFISRLSFGDRGEEVTKLQELLAKDSDVYPEGLVTGYFGSLTRAAINRFQEKHADEILAPYDLTEGVGFVGPKTREKLNELLNQ